MHCIIIRLGNRDVLGQLHWFVEFKFLSYKAEKCMDNIVTQYQSDHVALLESLFFLNWPEAMFSLDDCGRLCWFNHKAETLLGWKSAEVLGQQAHKLFCLQVGECAHTADGCLLQQLPEDEVDHFVKDVSWVKRDGSLLLLNYRKLPLIQGTLCAGELIIIYHRSQGISAESGGSQLALFPERNPAPLAEMDTVGNIHYANPAMTEWLVRLGYTSAGFPAVLPDGVTTLLEQCIKYQRSLVGVEVERDGIAIVWDFHPIADVSLVHCYGLDITGRRQTEAAVKAAGEEKQALKQEGERLEKLVRERTHDLEEVRDQALSANDSMSCFIAHISHEIRTPMGAVIGYAEMMQDSDISREEMAEMAQTIVHNSHYLLSIINDILDMSKIQAGKLDVERISVTLSQLLADVESVMTPQAQRKQLYFKVELEYPLPECFFSDPVRLEQILVNLCGNAIKFTKKGGVCLRTTFNSTDNKLCFSISDTGIGMTEEEIGKLFQPYTQADVSTTRCFGGTGLGLFISRRLVELLMGDIRVKSQSGVGSCFDVTVDAGSVDRNDFIWSLPLEKQADSNIGIQTPELHGSILVAEDNLENQRLLSFLIKKTGAAVTLVENGQMAIDKAMSEEFDLLLMDINMPVMDGLTALEFLRKASYTKPVVALTANTMKQQIETYLHAGFNDHIGKPFDQELFYRLIATYLSPPIMARPGTIATSIAVKPLMDRNSNAALSGRVLYAEDDQTNQSFLARLLRKTNIALTLVENGVLAVEAALKSDFDLILMDIQMPVMHGVDATKILIKSGYTKPIVALTANVMKDQVKSYYEAGCVDVVAKPIDRTNLFEVLRTHLPKHDLSKNISNDWRDDAEFQELHAMFRTRLGELRNQLEAAICEKANDQVANLAHSLKGVAGNLGYHEISAAAAELEQLAKLGEDERVLFNLYNQIKRLSEPLLAFEA